MGGGFGYYGKLPAQGDFLRRGLGPDVVAPWDLWVQSALLAAREALGADWQDAYLTAPIWRFALPPGLCGETALAGVMMPSVDRVGRQFPFTIAAPIDAENAWAAHLALRPVHAALEEAALAMLEDAADRAGLDARLGALAAEPAPGLPALPAAAGPLCLSAEAGTDPTATLVADALDRRFARPSLWECEVAGITRLLACDGLPGPREALALMDLSAPLWSGAADPVIPEPR